ncbi:homeodomain-like protein [Tanacetum coccineum]
MPLSTYLNLGFGKLAHTKLTVELADRTVKYPKGIAENVLVSIGKFVFPVDFAILDMPEDIKVSLILGRPFLSTARAKIDVLQKKDNFTGRGGESHPRFKLHTNEQCNKILPLLKVSEEDKMNGISHSYQKLKEFYKGVLNLGPDYIRDAKMEEWLTRGHVSVHKIE